MYMKYLRWLILPLLVLALYVFIPSVLILISVGLLCCALAWPTMWAITYWRKLLDRIIEPPTVEQLRQAIRSKNRKRIRKLFALHVFDNIDQIREMHAFAIAVEANFAGLLQSAEPKKQPTL